MLCMTTFNQQFSAIFGAANMSSNQQKTDEEKELERLKRLKDSDEQLIPPSSKPLRG